MPSCIHIFTIYGGVSKAWHGNGVVISLIFILCTRWLHVDCASSNATVTDTVNATVTDTVNATVTDTVNDTVTDTVNATVTDTVNATVTDTANATVTVTTTVSSENRTDSINCTWSVSNTTNNGTNLTNSNWCVQTNNSTTESLKISTTTAPLDKDLVIVLSYGGLFLVLMFTFVIMLCIQNACRPKYVRLPTIAPSNNNIRLI